MLESKIKAIVIPSGAPGKENIERAKRAIEYDRERNLNSKYIISGTGDINAALYGYRIDKGTDFHRDLYDYMMKNTSGIIGMDVVSKDSKGNILNTFPKEVSGRYGLVSYPLHLLRFKKVVEKARAKGQVSKDLVIDYIPTKQSLRQTFYGFLALLKMYIRDN